MIENEKLQLMEACRAAAADLGVRVTTPFVLIDSSMNDVGFLACFPDFGCKTNGALACHFEEWASKTELAEQRGYFCSGLHPDSYCRYDREKFMDALTDWGWHGDPNAAPSWYGVANDNAE